MSTTRAWPRHRRAIGVSLAFAIAAASAQAQPVSADASLRQFADTTTVGEYCTLAKQALASADVMREVQADSLPLRVHAAVICHPQLTHFSLQAITGRATAPWQAVARLRTDGYRDAQLGVIDAMTQFRSLMRSTPSRRQIVRTALGADGQRFVDVIEGANQLLAADARDAALVRLARYERKLGPTSARLNGPEVLLNVAAQKLIPGFRPSVERGPSPLELVASYVPVYVTFVQGEREPLPVSASEFGVRYYLFGERFGRTGWAGVLRPSYWSAGILTTSDRNGALVWPWRGRDRSGAFIGWGALKVGYVPRDGGSWLVSRQFQAIPLVF